MSVGRVSPVSFFHSVLIGAEWLAHLYCNFHGYILVPELQQRAGVDYPSALLYLKRPIQENLW